MGLDSYWTDEEGAVLPWPQEDDVWRPKRIVNGTFSGAGAASFRGKAYDAIVTRITGETLYQDTIPNEKVREMADKLWAVYEEYGVDDFGPGVELYSLARMFKVYAEAGAQLRGWW